MYTFDSTSDARHSELCRGDTKEGRDCIKVSPLSYANRNSYLSICTGRHALQATLRGHAGVSSSTLKSCIDIPITARSQFRNNTLALVRCLFIRCGIHNLRRTASSALFRLTLPAQTWSALHCQSHNSIRGLSRRS